MAEEEHELGREATKPTELRTKGWKDVTKRTREQVKKDHVTLIAAGVAFYAFFSLFPALFALVAIYGLVADPAQVQAQVSGLSGVLPASAQQLVGTQLSRIAATSSSTLGWGLALSVLIAFWSASKATRGLVEAINIAYDEEEKRGFFKLTALNLALTIGGIVAALIAIGLVVVVPPVLANLGLGAAGQIAAHAVRWILLAGFILLGLAILYRVGPSRDSAKWRWITPGSILAGVLWLLASVAFSLYASRFGSYEKTFGSLAAVAILLMWFYISALVVILGAELNAEAEHQTREDTTRGPSEPMGQRGAYPADHLGRSTEPAR